MGKTLVRGFQQSQVCFLVLNHNTVRRVDYSDFAGGMSQKHARPVRDGILR